MQAQSVCRQLITLTLIALLAQPPEKHPINGHTHRPPKRLPYEVAAVRAERGLTQKGGHKFVPVDLVHPTPHRVPAVETVPLKPLALLELSRFCSIFRCKATRWLVTIHYHNNIGDLPFEVSFRSMRTCSWPFGSKFTWNKRRTFVYYIWDVYKMIFCSLIQWYLYNPHNPDFSISKNFEKNTPCCIKNNYLHSMSLNSGLKTCRLEMKVYGNRSSAVGGCLHANQCA